MAPEIDQLQLLNTITEIRVELGKLSTRLEKLDDFTRTLEDQRRQLHEMSKKMSEIEDVANRACDSAGDAKAQLGVVKKVVWWILTAAGGTAITMVVNFSMKGGFANP